MWCASRFNSGPLVVPYKYINDISSAIKHCDYKLYADDTIIYFSDDNIETAQHRLQTNLNSLSNWCEANVLTINTNKTKLIQFGTKHSLKKDRGCHITLKNKLIGIVSNYKYLGVILDSTLTFSKHVKNVIKTTAHKTYIYAI